METLQDKSPAWIAGMPALETELAVARRQLLALQTRVHIFYSEEVVLRGDKNLIRSFKNIIGSF